MVTTSPTKHPPLVAIIMGSKSDAAVMYSSKQILDLLEIPCECRIISAHRSPHELAEFVQNAPRQGIEVFIAGAGASAALPGAIAAHTIMPVIGVPLNATALQGIDALLAIAQMPAGVPVACMAIGDAGAKNASLMAARILALKNDVIRQRLSNYYAKMKTAAQETSLGDPFLT